MLAPIETTAEMRFLFSVFKRFFFMSFETGCAGLSPIGVCSKFPVTFGSLLSAVGCPVTLLPSAPL